MELRRREFGVLMLGGAAALSLAGRADAEDDPLPSWNAGPAKDAIVKFVQATTDPQAPTSSRLRSASRPSTKTARYGSSTRSIRSSSTASIGCRRL